MDTVPIVDLREGGPPAHAKQRREQALALRAACLGWLPCGGLLARLADPLARWWLRRSASPLVGEIDSIARALRRPGIWLLHGAYAFGCTALADESEDGPVLRRTLDWPFPGLGRLVEVTRQRGAAGEFLSVTWPGFAGVLTAVAPGRFAASINQAPMHVGRLAAVVGLCAERHGGLLHYWLPAARACASSSVRDLRDVRRSLPLAGADASRAACPFPHRRLCGRRAGADRARRRSDAHPSRPYRGRQCLARPLARLAATRLRRGHADRE